VKNLPSLQNEHRFFTAFILNAVSAKGGCAFGAEGFRMTTNFIYRIPESFWYKNKSDARMRRFV
jgi:hypothetical protein